LTCQRGEKRGELKSSGITMSYELFHTTHE
jgi:hypothetical protein